MGCASSAQHDEADSFEKERRLSVAPNQSNAKGDTKMNDDATAVKVLDASSSSLAYAYKSRKGMVPYNKNKVNQDRGIISYCVQDDSSISLWGVMDGHGEFGHLVADFIQKNIVSCISQQQDLRTQPERAITEGVKKLCEELTHEQQINVAFSGSTLVFGVHFASKFYVANVGDSRCVLCRQNDNGELQAIGLSIDQKPDNPKEKARILKSGGRVEPLPGPPGEDCGPPRVWLAEVDVPGLAMSRSIGDEVSQTVGVISVPEIIPHQVQSNDIFAIFATDGVWEFLSNEQAVSIVWKYKHDLQEAANQLVEEATKQWKKEEEVIDDITVIIVMFNQAK